MLLRQGILAICIALCLICNGCGTTVKVINFNDSEYFEMEKDGIKYYCLSDFYLKKVLEAKIKKVNAK
jgi:hypothetical protein